MDFELYVGEDFIPKLVKTFPVKFVSYLVNPLSGRVQYLLISSQDKAVLVRYSTHDPDPDFEAKVIDIVSSSSDIDTMLRELQDRAVLLPVEFSQQDLSNLMYPLSNPQILKLARGEEVKPEDVARLLDSGDLEAINDLFANDKILPNADFISEVINLAERPDEEAVRTLLGHTIFKLEDYTELEKLSDLLEAYSHHHTLGTIFREKSLYVRAKRLGIDFDENEYKRFKKDLEDFIKALPSAEDRAFTFYETITVMGLGDVEVLKDMLFSFDKYIPYSEEFSPLIFGDLGMSFYNLWDDTDIEEYKELALVLLQKAIFSFRELIRLGKTRDMFINLSNLFAYSSVLIPMLCDEAQKFGSGELANLKIYEAKSTLCLCVNLFIKFFDSFRVEVFRDFYPTEEDAFSMVKSTYDNFILAVETFIDEEIEPRVEEVWDRHVPNEPEPEDLLKGALEVRRVLCD
ncbi:MAG: hypothetical protein GXO18_07810 [Aquificae bacterium]|nr:hypothetical protein [Aquificota bacterium]